MTTPDLNHWHARLACHFELLADKRHSGTGTPPVFALEHGLAESEMKAISEAVRAHIKSRAPSWNHRLPWIVYAAELGYRYSGDEYWQTFEAETPGWTARGTRSWIRKCYWWFRDKYGGATPSGDWAKWFTIICWPITHAVLPKDLQRQLARSLYDIRHSFSQKVFASPGALGRLIAARSWTESSRFQNLAQETELVGQIAAALLFEGESGTERLLHRPTLTRISHDLDGERRRREWLRVARRSAKERARIRGLAREPRHAPKGRRTEDARAEVAALGIEPRLMLQPADAEGTAWKVLVEFPDLSNMSLRFPNTRKVLTESRCFVAGSQGRPIARGRFLYGSQRLVLTRWPNSSELLLRFEPSHPEMDFLLRTECLLQPGPPWLLRIASDGLAYECRGSTVRPGQRYIVLTTTQVPPFENVVHPTSIQCQDIQGVLLDLPPALDSDLERLIESLELRQSKSIEVWPAGLAAALWDGEGHGEWLAGERPTLGIQSDHPLGRIKVSLEEQGDQPLELDGATPGTPVFLELPSLSIGLHTIRVEATGPGVADTDNLGHLQVAMRVREARPWHHGVSPAGPLAVRVDPAMPTLEQLWDGQVEVEILGPPERTVACDIALLEKGKAKPTARIGQQLALPITPSQWTIHFKTHFRENKRVQKKYDAAYACRLNFAAGELGKFTVRCEREFTPLRWALGERNREPIVRLIDDTGRPEAPCVSRFLFGRPAVETVLEYAREYEVPAPGGLYWAKQGNFSASIIAAVSRIRSFAGLTISPVIGSQERSLPAVLEAVALGCKWAAARSSGDILSVTNRRKALQVITRHASELIGGGVWAQAESDFDGTSDLSVLARAVTKRRGEVGVVEALAQEVADLAQASTRESVSRLAELATLQHILRANTGDSAVYRDPDWMAEFALRLASSPRDAEKWADRHLRLAITNLMQMPVLARAGRFIVVSTDNCLGANAAPDEIYAGWKWP